MPARASRFRTLGFPLTSLVVILAGLVGCGDDDDPTHPSLSDPEITGLIWYEGSPTPAAGASVYLWRDDGIPLFQSISLADSTVADPLGSYDFVDVPAGRYRVYAGAWNRDRSDFSAVSPLSAAFDLTGDGAVVVNPLLYGTVFDTEVTGELTYEVGGVTQPADSAVVTLYRYLGGRVVPAAEVISDPGGEYLFSGVQTGNYVLTAVKTTVGDGPFSLFVTEETDPFFCDGVAAVQLDPLFLTDVQVDKPAVYIYPEKAQAYQVRLGFSQGTRLTASEPEYRDGWKIFVETDGRIDDRYDYLFYEVAAPAPRLSEGYCVPREHLAEDLEALVASIGLNPAESDAFLEYWLLRLPPQPYYLIYPVFGDDLKVWVELEVTPAADSTLRFWFFFQGSAAEIHLTAPNPPRFERSGTTVIEWGGAWLPVPYSSR